MINATSPTIAAMIDNTPQGIGNMPYNPQMVPNYGTVGYQPNPSFNNPYPSPKDMLTQAGQMNVYQPTTFASPFAPPQNIIGGYNPGYNASNQGFFCHLSTLLTTLKDTMKNLPRKRLTEGFLWNFHRKNNNKAVAEEILTTAYNFNTRSLRLYYWSFRT